MVAFSSSFYGLSFLVTISMLYRIALANAFSHPYIRPKKIGILEIGNIYTLTCTVSGVTEYTLVWSKDSSRIPSSGRIIQTHMESIHNLTFSHLQYDDQGWYECKIKYNATTSIRSEIQIQFPAYKKEYEINDSPNILVKMGQDVHLLCEILHLKDSVLSHVHWNYEGTELSLPKSRFNVDSDNQLTIESVSASDGGTYKCILSTDREFKLLGPNIVLMVVVAQFPLLISVAGDKSAIVAGGVLRLRCSFTFSKPAASRIIWKKNSQIIIPDSRIIEPKMGILQIKNLQTRDEGHYSCIVENKILDQFISSQSISIRIGASPTESVAPFFVYPNHLETRDILRSEGKPLTIECLGFGIPSPPISWKKRLNNDDGWVEVNEEDEIRFTGNRNLKFESLNVSHSGLYSCVLNANTEHTITRDFRLVVFDSPPDMIARLSNANPRNGGYVKITCEIIQPSQYFVLPYHRFVLKNGEPVSNYQFDNFTAETSFGVVINSITTDDEGFYQCQVWSPAGYSSTWTTLMVEQEYVAENYVDPESMTITLLSSEMAIFKWSSTKVVSAHGQTYSHFIVHIVNQDHNILHLSMMNEQNFTLFSYKPDVSYSIYIRTKIIQNSGVKISDPLPPLFFHVASERFFPKVKISSIFISPTGYFFKFSSDTNYPKLVDGYEIQLLDFTETGTVKFYNFTHLVENLVDSAFEIICGITNLRQSASYGLWVQSFNIKVNEKYLFCPEIFKWDIFITPKEAGGADANVGQYARNRGEDVEQNAREEDTEQITRNRNDENADVGPKFICKHAEYLPPQSTGSDSSRNLETPKQH